MNFDRTFRYLLSKSLDTLGGVSCRGMYIFAICWFGTGIPRVS